jgi:LysM repeat protein
MILVNMRKTIGVVLMALFLLLNAQLSEAGVQDSIGVEKKDGKRFVLHRLEAKETLYSLSRRYGASVDDIKKANAEVNLNQLKIGQVLRVPSPEKTVNANKPSSATHIVITGETLYSIAKKYNVSVDEMKKLNPNAANGLSIGDELLIPGKPVEQTIKRGDTPVSTTTTTPSNTSHTVASGETLYSISRKYNISVDDLKSWNPETSAGLKVGQVLKLTPIVVKLDPPATTEKPKPVIVVDEVKKEPVVTETKKEPVIVQQTTPPDTILTKEQEQEKKYLDSMANIRVQPNGEFKKVTETGFAEIIDGGDTDKYLALHKTAPVGTIIQVINEGNNQRIFVRVIGKLPANGLNDRVVLKISKKAFERLAGVDKKIPVTLSYIM